MKLRIPFLLTAGLCFCTSALSAEGTLTVEVRETKLRSEPKHWASGVATLKYGDSITPIKSDADWVEGRWGSKLKGFVHVSALTSKQIILSSNKSTLSTVDPSDVVLAGKGFSRATEEAYAKTHGVNFKALQSVETTKVSDGELVAFMREGAIGEGAR